MTEAVVVDGYPGSRSMAAVYNQTFGPGQRFGDGEIWSTTAPLVDPDSALGS